MIKFVDDTAIHVLEDENDLKMYKEEVLNFFFYGVKNIFLDLPELLALCNRRVYVISPVYMMNQTY